jgi:hypothetical protein
MSGNNPLKQWPKSSEYSTLKQSIDTQYRLTILPRLVMLDAYRRNSAAT